MKFQATVSKQKIFVQFLAFFLLSLLVFFLDKKGFLDFVKRPVEKLTNSVKWVAWQKQTELGDYGEETEALLRELAALQIENQNLKEENQACRRLLQAPLPPSFHFLPAKVLSFQENRFLIDKGQDNEVKEGQVVVLENVILGIVTLVNPQNAWVKTPSALEIKARTFKTRAPGVVKEKSGHLFLSEVLQKEVLEIDDLVITFGQEEIPRDLVIAKIKEIKKQAAEVYQEAELEPLVDYGKLEVVFIVL